MSLYLGYRPQEFEQIKGNREVLESIQNALQKDFPHSILLTGPTGCGKTTIARIISKQLGAKGLDIVELDFASLRGIDNVRDIIQKSQYRPIEGKVKVWIVDECFTKGSMVTMHDGIKKPIEDIKPGESVYNLFGKGKIQHTFINRLPFEKLTKINFSNNKEIICSNDHLFLTTQGWVKAKNLENCFIYLDIFNNFVGTINPLNIHKNETSKNLSPVWSRINKRAKKVLHFFMQQSGKSNKIRPNRDTEMSNMPKRVRSKMFQPESNMLHGVRKQISRTKTKRTAVLSRTTSKYFQEKESISKYNRSRKETQGILLIENETKQPFQRSPNCSKNKSHKTNERHSSCMERGTRRQRKINRTTDTISNSIRLGDGSCSENKPQPKRWFRFSNLLQNRYGQSIVTNRNRSRWAGTPDERSQTIRLEKNKQITKVRVEGVEIYQRGSNERSFQSVIGDKERNQNYIELHDLEIENHHSYIVEDVLVHNCHKATNDAQNAMLKILEDTPQHVYFILCTTDPQKLIKTIQGRCSTFQVNPLDERQMMLLLREVVKAEGESLLKPVYEQIIMDSLGHPRNALQILEQVLNVEEDKRLEVAKRSAEKQSQSIELCRILIQGGGWKRIAEILKGLKDEDPESIRRHILGYCQAVLLNKGDERTAVVLEAFLEPFYNTGMPGLVFACYEASHT